MMKSGHFWPSSGARGSQEPDRPKSESGVANILFTTTGTDGDVLPVLRIGSRLKTRGHDVTLLTHAGYAGLAAEAGLDFAALDNATEYNRSVAEGPMVNSPQGIPEFLRRHYFTKVPLECDLVRQRCRALDTLLVARDLFDIGARIAAEKFGIPLL